ncbi:peptidase M23 [Sulfuricaulis limicola]|uniref:Peptidase M23 n=1 Tax=Sulfuricaulis limicola TaxID=1620215 RepID=A0A1B4XCY8_9GAMM|nr:peptidoglycan DD-metalloendopeptidase family protein [Sulfuricaulis limicola]BAV32687.1 peptidase M23 [Sulfuricaulis limicola]
MISSAVFTPRRKKDACQSGRTIAAVLLAFLIAVLFPAHAADGRGGEEARLKQLRGRIEALQERLNETRGRRDDVREEVRGLERRIGGLMNNLRMTEAQLRANEKRLADLNARAARERGNLGAQRQQLARQIYMAYHMGRQEYLKLLLNQENPARVARVATYYDYLNRARTERISQTQMTLSRLETLEQQIRAQRRDLDDLRTSQHEQKTALETSRARRGELLASLNREVRGQSQQMERLRADEKRLEQLIEELKTVLPEPNLPPRAGTPFAKLRGRLPLPTRGPLLARYGGSKNLGNLKWRGLLIGGREGQNVISVFRGRVVFADWLRGFGLLLILDHGDGYMTLYGHNQSLHKGVGEWVEAGEIVASLGNTGDMAQPAVYFEIRQNGQPRDPLIWCKAR